MKNEDLIRQLSDFAMEMEVCILDTVVNEKYASDEPCSAGVHRAFNVYKVHTDDELEELKDEFPNVNNFIALEFDSEIDYEDEIKEIKEKAEAYDKLYLKVQACYVDSQGDEIEGPDDGLITIGEICATELGFL